MYSRGIEWQDGSPSSAPLVLPPAPRDGRLPPPTPPPHATRLHGFSGHGTRSQPRYPLKLPMKPQWYQLSTALAVPDIQRPGPVTQTGWCSCRSTFDPGRHTAATAFAGYQTLWDTARAPVDSIIACTYVRMDLSESARPYPAQHAPRPMPCSTRLNSLHIRYAHTLPTTSAP